MSYDNQRQADASTDLVELLRHEVVRYEDSCELPTEFAERVAALIRRTQPENAVGHFVK